MSNVPKLDAATLRKVVAQLRAAPKWDFKLPMRDDIRLSVGGVVVIPGFGYMHPYTFRDIAGIDAYNHLLTLPRIISEYD